jgi:hypothetical protein
MTITMNPANADSGTPVQYAIFIVTLSKNDTARATMARTGDLQNIVQGEDYTAATTLNNNVAYWDLNPEIYTVKAVRRGTIGVFTVASTGQLNPTGNISDAQQNHTIVIPHKRKLTNGGIVHSMPTWRQLDDDGVPINDRLYLVISHNAVPHPPTGGQQIGFAGKPEFTGYVPI